MEDAVVGAVVGATIQVVIQNLLSVSMKEIELVRDFKKDLEKLRSTLIMIQSILYDAEMQLVTDMAVKHWLRKLEDVAFEADNVLDDINYQLLRKDTKTTMKKKVKSIFSGSKFRLKFGHKMRAINKDLELINREASNFGLQMRLVGVRAPGVGSDASATLETDSFTVDPIFVGRDNDMSRIAEMLIGIPTEQEFSVLPIVGMGGLGKTTLTRKIYHHRQIYTRFGTRIWVHVSKNFDPVILFKKILASLTREKVEDENREVLLKKLQEALAAKTYLLVLDDVWNQDRLKWEGFMNSWSGITSMKGNGIIVTTRNREVASIVQTLPVYELKGLEEDNCWSIIEAKAFVGEDIPSGFETIGRNIAKNCHGLPLAANVVGGVLRGKSIDEWLSIEQSWLSDLKGDENNILKILKLSYDHLSLPLLKKCFAYCLIFPKGKKIDKQELIELWMAEGFLQLDQRSDMESLGNNFFNLLLQSSLLQVVEIDGYGNVMYCSMHDLVHDLACSVLDYPKVNDSISDGNYPARYIRWECNGDESSHIPKGQAKCLRTLFLKGTISSVLFSDFKCLHVLILVDFNVEEVPSSIRELIHLRYFDISNTRIKCLPDWIGELYHLQTIRAHKHSLRKIPNTFKYLINLRHLYIDDIVEFPSELGMLTSLQTIPYFRVGNEDGHRITELGSLKNLKGELKIHNLENVRGEVEAKKAYIFQKPNIVKLVLRWEKNREGEINDEKVLEGLQPHPNIKILEVFGFKGTDFPSWTFKMAVYLEGRWVGLNNLMEIKLSNCEECDNIPMLGHLPCLKSLYLSHLSNVKSIGSSFYGNDGVFKKTIIVFPALQRLDLSNMPNLIEWVEIAETDEVKVFPCLEYLEIRKCKQLRSAPSQFPCLKELYIEEMDSGLQLANIRGIRLTSLTKLYIRGIYGLVSLPDWLFYNNQNLSQFCIISCPNLRQLPDGLHTLKSLELLTIVRCPNLKSIPFSLSGEQSQSHTLLRSLLISECEGLINLPYEMVESSALSLEDLRLEKLSSVANLPMMIECLHKMPCLKELTILNVPKLITSSSIEASTFCSLQDLTIGPASDSSDSISFNKTVDGILQLGSQSLHRFQLFGMEDWDSLPDSLQHLTALSWLELYKFGIEELPEWFGNLSSLTTLYLYDCKKLRRLPSVEAMRRLTKFTYLTIEDCPVLKLRCIEQQTGDDDDSEWPKVSHLSFIYVDGRPIQFWGRQVYL